jgi:hypothetical protein
VFGKTEAAGQRGVGVRATLGVIPGRSA